MPRTTAENVRELHTLLQNAGEKPPYVLVGHSFGGNSVRVFASRYPAEVAGIVLADTGHEDMKFPENFNKLMEEELRRRQHNLHWARLLYWSGIARFEARTDIENPALTFDQREWNYFQINPNFKAAAASELENLREGNDQMRGSGKLGDTPLIVLIAGSGMFDLPLAPEDDAIVHDLWVDLEKRLAALSTRGKWVMVPDSGHMMPFHRPDAIVNAAQELCKDARSH